MDQGRRIPAKEERESERRRPGSWCVSGFGGHDAPLVVSVVVVVQHGREPELGKFVVYY